MWANPPSPLERFKMTDLIARAYQCRDEKQKRAESKENRKVRGLFIRIFSDEPEAVSNGIAHYGDYCFAYDSSISLMVFTVCPLCGEKIISPIKIQDICDLANAIDTLDSEWLFHKNTYHNPIAETIRNIGSLFTVGSQ